MPATRANPKDRARRALDALPDDASMEDVIARLVVLHKVERGMEEVRRGEGLMSQSEVEEHFARRRAERAS